MMKKFTGRINTDIYINSAIELGLKYVIDKDNPSHLTIFNGTSPNLEITLARLSCNKSEARKLSKDKMSSLTVLDKNNIQTTLGKIFKLDNFENIREYCAELLKSSEIVIKKNFGKGGKHVYIHIKNMDEVKEVVSKMKSDTEDKIEEVIIEKHFVGENYRVLVMDGEVLDIIHRLPANVIGNGVHTVQELIDQKNFYKKENKDRYLISPAKIDFSKISLDLVPLKGERFNITPLASLSLGGDVRRINLTKISEKLISEFKKIQELSGLVLCGIDIISKDLEKSDATFVVNEYNTSPGMSLHYLADYEYSLKIPKAIISKYFSIQS